MECPTVRIKATTGSYPFTTINESDFDPAKHELYPGEIVLPAIGEGLSATANVTAAPADASVERTSDAPQEKASVNDLMDVVLPSEALATKRGRK